jgi:RNA polymerase sigma-70 factor (ECF subfamily)
MDPALVTRAQHGDQEAFRALALSGHPRLFRVARSVLGDDQHAEDATQQALIAIWRYLPRLRDPQRYDGWSYRLLVRACYAEARRDPKWLPETALTGEHEPVASDDFLGVIQRDRLERAFRRLSVEHRAVIVLRYMLDLPLEQVAEALDVPVSTLASRQSRALQALRAAIEADERVFVPAVSQGVAR